ncbi:MAG: serine hydrolase domain-containing protein [Pseudomonadota bacterium]|nr:serine hydrolase domain-containing protein [Pseudomonadota bacterium]
MKKLGAVLSTVVVLAVSSGTLADDHQSMPKAAAVLDQTIATGKLNFAVAAVGNAGGQTWSHAAGYQDAEKTKAASPDNIIQIASMTKLVTTIAALQLVEQGKLDLDTPISAYAPELNELQVLTGFAADDTPIFEKANRAPTARELMTHTAGYAYEIWNTNALKSVQLGVTPSLLGEGNYLEAPLAFQPGTAWEYGINTDWLGVLVERLSDQRLAEYFDDNIFKPLGMTDTFYELPAGKLDRSVTMMARAAEGLVKLPSFQPTPMEKGSMPHYSGGGGLSSTVADYGRVLQMLLNSGSLDGKTLLKSETVDSMFQNNIGDIQPAALTTVMPTLSTTADMSFGNKATFGLGLLIHTDGIDGGRKANAGSWAGLFNSYYWVDREAGTYGIVGTQVLPFYDGVAIETLLELEQAVY